VIEYDEVRVGARGAVRCEAKGPWPESGQDAPLLGDAGGVEGVEVDRHRVVGLPVGGDGFGMADAIPRRKRPRWRAAIRW
jgi:hypothetical protein